MTAAKEKPVCQLCRVRGEGKPPAVAEYFLPDAPDQELNGWVPICEMCYHSIKRTGFQVRITNPKFNKIWGGEHDHDWQKMSIYPGKKGQEWKCRKCGAVIYCNIPHPDKGCHLHGEIP